MSLAKAVRREIPVASVLAVAAFVAAGAAVAQESGAVESPPLQWATPSDSRQADSRPSSLADVVQELRKRWPQNRTVRLVFHGHSVPAGYFRTPVIRRFDSYPSLVHRRLCDRFPTAAIDVSVTAIGGEHCESGAQRFADDVLAMKPDVVLIDYGLNDRRLGLDKSRRAWRRMIQQSQEAGARVILLTPTPDARETLSDTESPLARHAAQIRRLAAEAGVAIADPYAEFVARDAAGEDIGDYLSQANHPNRRGHAVVAERVVALFTDANAAAEPARSPR